MPGKLKAQSVSVGQGSYSLSLPPGVVGPQRSDGSSASPKISADFDQPIQTNDFWSSLIFPFFGDPYSSVLFAHPINAKATNTGLQIGYTTDHVFAGSDYLYPFSHQLTVGVDGLNVPETLTNSYGDWTVTAEWDGSGRSMEATLGHGLPFIYFRIDGGYAEITPNGSLNVWYQQEEVLGITIDGKHYGIFAPDGSEWTQSGSLQSNLDGKDYMSVALLPDNSPQTLELFRSHAYAFVTNSLVSWDYNENSSKLTTGYTYQTELMEDVNGNVNETLTALYRHQWLYAEQPVTDYTYQSPRGVMKLLQGNHFSTGLMFSGILPSLPDEGNYNHADLLNKVQQVAQEDLRPGPTYQNGKAMGRFAQLVNIADQLGADQERDYFLDKLKNRLEDWLTAGGEQEYSYNDEWDVLTGYPSGFGADREINDHHFHSSYAIRSAAIIAQFDPEWASQENWGGMINMLIKDSNNWDRSDEMVPFLRSHDAYAGHSWASGHGAFGDGNNQESSSESMNFASAVFLWGSMTDQADIRDLGIFLHSNERTAIEQYWMDVKNQVYPESYPHVALGIVWGSKGAHSTWFGSAPEFIHGINFLPMNSGSLYLGRHPDYVIENYDEIVQERGGQPEIWKDVLWEYLSLADPDRALSLYFADINYEPFDGESRAHTLHWLQNMKKMGVRDTSTYANIPTYSVFRNDAGEKTYAAFNPGSMQMDVVFSDGYTLTVPAWELVSEGPSTGNQDEPVAILIADKTSGKAPLTVNLEGNQSFDGAGGSLDFSWDIAGEASSIQTDTTYTFEEPGTYWVYLTVTNNLDISAQDSVKITALGSGTPYFDEPVQVPGRIEAEYYDKGGEGVAYHDREEQNIGQLFRIDEGVDIEASAGGGYDVYWITAGEWIEYTFNVETAGEFDITPYIATVPGFGNFKLLVDNEDIGCRRDVTNTGGWQNWTPIPVEDVYLEEGDHILRIEADSDSDPDGWLFSVNYFDITQNTSVSNKDETSIPKTVELNQNYPNPFNPTTVISYSLPRASDVRIEIFNMLGQRVALLVNERIQSGQHTAAFQAGHLSSGIYIYRMQAEGFTETRKMLLVK
ncbi:glycosyl hydrolase [Rhodohalobacter sp. 8-1]|uniref:glycosyl hydrolase n=1 Tax=Rhodohalobacter sp. 8-1 TaxID=3131972 RepID=UPI0030ED8413